MSQRVRPAAQVLSNSVAKAIEYCGRKGLMPKKSNWTKAAEIVQLFNDWFDLLNSRSKLVGNCPWRSSFGTDLEAQKALLNNMSELINSMRVGKHKSLIPFQKGILLSNRSLIEMYDYVHEKYNVEYIMTSRLNQDVLENFFAYIRGMGGANDHPSPLDFKYRLRWFILGKHSAAIFTENRNTVETNENCLLDVLSESPNGTNEDNDDVCLTQTILSNFNDSTEAVIDQSEAEKLITSSFVQPEYLLEADMDDDTLLVKDNFEVKDEVNKEALTYIAGYIAYRFRNKYSLGIPTHKLDTNKAPDWLQFISQGNLMHPNEELLELAFTLESEFYSMHKTSLCNDKRIFKNLADRTLSKFKCNIPFEVVLCLSRTRTYIRLRDLNRKISFNNCKKKLDKKLSKFTNHKI